jgi:hypothetical protein
VSDSDKRKTLTKSTRPEISDFLAKVAKTPVSSGLRENTSNDRGRLMFAMDATASREATWDYASSIQGEMFEETASIGGLDIQLCYFRGFSEFTVIPWLHQSSALLNNMAKVTCQAGKTQIERILIHTVEETQRKKVDALVFVGDSMEEDVDQLCELAGQLAIHNVKLFVFHEGFDPIAEAAFLRLAAITHGAYCRFDSGSAQQLKKLLGAVAVYAAGGYKALDHYHKRIGSEVLKLPQKIG